MLLLLMIGPSAGCLNLGHAGFCGWMLLWFIIPTWAHVHHLGNVVLKKIFPHFREDECQCVNVCLFCALQHCRISLDVGQTKLLGGFPNQILMQMCKCL